MSDVTDVIASYDGLTTDDVVHFSGCSCTGCQAAKDDLDRSGSGSTGSTTSVAIEASLSEMADYLQLGYWNSSTGRHHNVGTTGYDPNNGVLLYNVSGYSADANGISAARAELVRDSFDLFEAVLGIDFQETTSTDTSTVDFFFRDNDSGAYAGGGSIGGKIRYSEINVASSWSGGTSTYDDYTLQTILHEIGHALGLGHQGQYNGSASYGSDAIYELDSWQATMMSYFSQNENTAINANYEFLQTPMAVDWLALDNIYSQYGYGISNAFRGDTIYGFNTNISEETSRIWHEFSNYANRTASTIVDGDGIDTLDVSGYSANQKIDLTIQTEGQTSQNTSNIGGRTGNLTLAVGTVIENAVGGSGNDEIIGNSADNILSGGAGNDRLTGLLGDDQFHGNAGTDTVVFSFGFSSYAFSLFGSAIEVVGEGIDHVFDTVENLEFSDGLYSFASLFQNIDNIKPEADDDLVQLDEGQDTTVSILSNDSDEDGDALTVVMINGVSMNVGDTLVLSSGADVRLNANGTVSYSQNGAFAALDNGQTATETITYRVTDGVAFSDAVLTIRIAGNSAPDARNDTLSTKVGVSETFDLLQNDKDDDGDALEITAINGTAINKGGSVTLASGARVTLTQNGTVVYDQLGVFLGLAAGTSDVDTFNYTISDGLGSDTAIANITVTANSAPIVEDEDLRIGEGRAFELDVLKNDIDRESDELTIVEIEGKAISVGGSVTLESGARIKLNADGTLTYDQRGAFDSLENWETDLETFEYTVFDGSVRSKGKVDIEVSGFDKPSSDYDDWYVGKSKAEWLAAQVVGNQKVFAGKGNDDVIGSDVRGGDILSGGDGRDWLWGLSGDDVLLGGDGEDRLFGGDGRDSLFGGEENDRLIGGAGADQFVFEDNTGDDVIVDFETEEDQMVIDLNAYVTFDDLSSKFVRQGDDLLIRLSSDDSVRLLDVDLSELDESHFVFV